MSKVKLLSDELHQKVLGYTPPEIPRSALARMQANWEAFGLAEAVDETHVVNLPYPEGLGNYQEVLEDAVGIYGRSWLDRLHRFASVDVPAVPVNFLGLTTGWNLYDAPSRGWVPCKPPEQRTLVLDFETGWLPDAPHVWYPAVCGGVSEGAWYLWVADFENPETVTPFGSGNLVIAHNAGFDRSYLASEYALKDSGNRFFDTMAAWLATRGFSNQQLGLLKLDQEGELDDYQRSAMGWLDQTGGAGLSDVHEFYLGTPLDKGVRDDIIRKGLTYIQSDLYTVARYCLEDVAATHKIFRKLYPEWLQGQPSEVSQTAQLLLGNTWLPLSSDRFPEYWGKAEGCYQAALKEISDAVERRIADVMEQYQPEVAPLAELKGVPVAQRKEVLAARVAEFSRGLPESLSWLDWTPAIAGKAKGLPKWYRDLAAKAAKRLADGKPAVSLAWREVVGLLGLQWEGLPIFWDGKGFAASDGRIPHPDEPGKPVTNLTTKSFLKAADAGLLTAEGDLQGLLGLLVQTVNWSSLRERVKAIHTESPEGFPVTLPQLVVTGTVTRRCTDRLWQVSSNPKSTRVGTELKSMVEAPEGWRVIGADVDQEEVWIASLMADTAIGFAGSSPLALTVLIGDKSKKTDLHSVNAAKAGIDRDAAKVLGYSALYGVGLQGATNGLKQANPVESREACEGFARNFLLSFKGMRSEYTREWVGGLASEAFNYMERVANQPCPATPVLGAKLSHALRGVKDFATSRQNWVIQSSGVDYRDIWVLVSRYLWDRYDVEGRLMITIHDEARFLVREDQTVKAAWLLQIAHLIVRAAFTDAFGLNGIPASCAWHSAIDVDRVLRKDPFDPQVTPSQPDPIAPGESWSPTDLSRLLESHRGTPVLC